MNHVPPPPLARFTIVERRPLGRPRRGAWTVGAAILAAAGLVAASSLLVTQNGGLAALHAERYDVGEAFMVLDSAIGVAKGAKVALGVEAAPVELGLTEPAARVAIPADVWTYSVSLKEASAASVTGGKFTAELFIDEVSAGRIFLAQESSNATLIESARLSFPIGAALSTSALYFLVVEPFVPTGPTIDLTVKSTPNGNLTWTGVGGTIEGVVNPTLPVTVGATVRLTARNDDGITHDVGIKDSAGNLVNPPGWSPDFESVGSESTISWIPSAPGAFTYVCKYHAGTMRGTLQVT